MSLLLKHSNTKIKLFNSSNYCFIWENKSSKGPIPDQGTWPLSTKQTQDRLRHAKGPVRFQFRYIHSKTIWHYHFFTIWHSGLGAQTLKVLILDRSQAILGNFLSFCTPLWLNLHFFLLLPPILVVGNRNYVFLFLPLFTNCIMIFWTNGPFYM